jgi:hypothetical protein
MVVVVGPVVVVFSSEIVFFFLFLSSFNLIHFLPNSTSFGGKQFWREIFFLFTSLSQIKFTMQLLPFFFFYFT